MRSFLLTFIAGIIVTQLFGQQIFGVVNSTRAGISGAKINPAFIGDSRVWLDVNLLTIDGFEENNFLYLPSEHYYVGKLFQKKPNWRDYDGRPFRDYYDKNNQWNLMSQIYIQLPSLMLTRGDHTFGFQMNMRQHLNLSTMDNHMAKFMVEGLDFRPQQNIYYHSDEFRFAQASWFEAGLSYAHVFHRIKRHHWTAGITVKRLFGINSFFLNAANTDYIVYNDSTLHVLNTDLEYGYSPSSAAGSEIIDFSGGMLNGGGWAFDIGIMYQKKAEGNGFTSFNVLCEQKYDNYIYKIGLSLIDLGWINYKGNAGKFRANQTEIYWTNLNSYRFNGVNTFSNDLSAHASPATQQVASDYTVFLPAAVSLQSDFRVYPRWYVNATGVQGLPIGDVRLRMPSIVALTPRYETRIIEVNLPLMLYDWYKPRVGFAVRFFGVTIGTDYLNTLFGTRDFTGFDLYFSLKMKLEKGMCVKGFSEFLRGRNYYQYACPD